MKLDAKTERFIRLSHPPSPNFIPTLYSGFMNASGGSKTMLVESDCLGWLGCLLLAEGFFCNNQKACAFLHTPHPRANSSPVGGCSMCSGHSSTVPGSCSPLGPAKNKTYLQHLQRKLRIVMILFLQMILIFP